MKPEESDSGLRRVAATVDFAVSCVSWLRIVLSPTGIAIAVGSIIYVVSGRHLIGAILGCVIVLIGLIVGVLWAERVRKGEGTFWFVSRIDASPDADKPSKSSNTTGTD